MAAELVAVDLATRRRSTIGYAAGMAVYTVVVVALYPAFKDATDLDEMLADQPGLSSLFGISGSLTTPPGWLSGNIYANFLPLILLFVTIGHGAATLAGEEGRGRLDLVLALPRPTALGRRPEGGRDRADRHGRRGRHVPRLAARPGVRGRRQRRSTSPTTTLGALLMALAFGLAALAIGGGTGERGLAIGVASTIAAASYLLSSLGQTVAWLKPWRPLSLFYWSVGNDQLDRGLGWDGLAVLAASVTVALARIDRGVRTPRRHRVNARSKPVAVPPRSEPAAVTPSDDRTRQAAGGPTRGRRSAACDRAPGGAHRRTPRVTNRAPPDEGAPR